jgi:hypothetical protein
LSRRQALGVCGAAIISAVGAGTRVHGIRPATRCEAFTRAETVISASPRDPAAPVLVDDDVTVTVNGEVVYQDDDPLPSRTVIGVGAVKPGDKLRVQASDPVLGQAHQIGPLHLHCLDEGGHLLQTLDATGVTGNSSVGQPVAPFYDREFTLACMHA